VYRLSKVNFDQLDCSRDNGTAVSLPSTLRQEAVLFSRFDIDKRSVWQMQSALDLSFKTLLGVPKAPAVGRRSAPGRGSSVGVPGRADAQHRGGVPADAAEAEVKAVDRLGWIIYYFKAGYRFPNKYSPVRLSIRQLWYLGSLGCALSGCSVYAPMLPVAPQLRDKGEVEVQGTTFLNGRWEAGATYSPVRHLLVHAAGGLRHDNQDTTYFRIRQYEVGVGGYYPLGRRWLVSGLGGYGQARSMRGYLQSGLFNSHSELANFQSSYHRFFGELSVAYRTESGGVTLGAAYRLAQVKFDRLTYNGLPLGLRRMPRQEPMLFARFGNEEGFLPWLQFQTSVGITSVPGHYDATLEPYEYRRVRESRGFAALTLIVKPHLFKSPARIAN